MTEEEKKLLSRFETKLRHLIFIQEELQHKHDELQRLFEKERQEKNLLKAEYDNLKRDYADLKSAAAFGQNGGSVRETKQRIDKLVREIDLCIAQLE